MHSVYDPLNKPQMTEPATTALYEQPLNERMRSFLRMEYLYKRFDFQVAALDPWAHRGALEALIEIIALLGRADMKNEFIMELERHAQTMEALQANPRVDGTRLTEILARVRALLGTLRSQETGFGYELRNHDLISTVRQRSSIPAGTCEFDVPTLHNWLRRPSQDRQTELRSWLQHLDLVRECVTLCLGLVRESADPTPAVAVEGFFQRQLEGTTPCQLVQVRIPARQTCYTEISAGRHRFTIRFMDHTDAQSRPVQVTRDIAFELSCCVI